MILSNLYARVVIFIVAVVIYLQYMHYILTIPYDFSASIVNPNDRSIFKKFVDFRDIYIPAARPFIRSESNTEDEATESKLNNIAERQEKVVDKSAYIAEVELPQQSSKIVTVDKSKYIAELHQQSSTSTEQSGKPKSSISQPVKVQPVEASTIVNTPEIKSNLRKATNPDAHWNPEANPNSKFKKLKETITQHAKPHEMIDSDTMKVQVTHSHQYSPRNGSRIDSSSLSKKELNELLACADQPNCIIPALQLQRKINIYLCKKPKEGGGVRFYFLIKQGLLHHPNVILQEKLDSSTLSDIDYIFFLPGSSSWEMSECGSFVDSSSKKRVYPFVGPSISKRKMIVVEEFDGLEPLFSPYGTGREMREEYGPTMVYYLTYFKRSFVDRADGVFIDYPLINHKQLPQHPDVFPITYSIADDYISKSFNAHNHREIDILCTLRGSRNASSPMSTRIRVQEWTSEYVKTRKLTHAITEPVSCYRLELLIILIKFII